MFTRPTHRLTRAQQAVALLAIVVVCHLSAAAASAAPLHDFGDTINTVTETVADIGRAVAGLAVILVFLYMILEPMLPQFARENKGLLGRVALGCIGLGIAPDLVDLLFFT
jgi:hypothetical protein